MQMSITLMLINACTNALLMAIAELKERAFTLGGLDLSLGSVVWHGDGDDHVQGKELGVEGALGCHIDLHIH